MHGSPYLVKSDDDGVPGAELIEDRQLESHESPAGSDFRALVFVDGVRRGEAFVVPNAQRRAHPHAVEFLGADEAELRIFEWLRA